MRFIGCKLNLLPEIERFIVETLGIKEGIFCDIFAGTATVGGHFKKRGFQIISNDLLELSAAFQHALIANNTEPEFSGIIDTLGEVENVDLFTSLSPYNKVVAWLNCLPGKKGFIFNAYCPAGTMNVADNTCPMLTDKKLMLCANKLKYGERLGTSLKMNFTCCCFHC